MGDGFLELTPAAFDAHDIAPDFEVYHGLKQHTDTHDKRVAIYCTLCLFPQGQSVFENVDHVIYPNVGQDAAKQLHTSFATVAHPA